MLVTSRYTTARDVMSCHTTPRQTKAPCATPCMWTCVRTRVETCAGTCMSMCASLRKISSSEHLSERCLIRAAFSACGEKRV